MNKAQLIDALAPRMGGDRRAASVAVEGMVDIVVRTVQGGENVTITGFGVFEKRARAARVARNPRTGETVPVPPTAVPAFRPGAQFKDVVSGAAPLLADAPAVKRSAPSRPAGTVASSTVARKTVARPQAATTTTPAKPAKAAKAAKEVKVEKPAKAAKPAKAEKSSKKKKAKK